MHTRARETSTARLAEAPREPLQLKLNSMRAEPNRAVAISEGAWAVGSPLVSSSSALVTYNLLTCVAVTGYNKERKIGFMAHVNSTGSAEEAINHMAQLIPGKADVFIYTGGRGREPKSKLIVDSIKREVSKHPELDISGMDISMCLEWSSDLYRQVGLDTETGMHFVPINVVPVVKDPSFYTRPSVSLEYDGKVPLEVFTSIARN